MIKRIFLSLAVLLIAARAFAGLTITPAHQEITMPAGATSQGSYTVRNDYDQNAQIKVESRDWFVLPDNKGLSLSDGLTLSPTEFMLKPGESKEVKFSVQLSKKAQGVSVAMVSFLPEVENDQGVSLMMSVSLYVTAAGTEKVDWEIGDVSFNRTATEFTIMALIRNNGNVHLRPKGDVQIYSGSNNLMKINFSESRPVYPGSPRTIAASSSAGTIPEGKYIAVIQLNAAGQTRTKQVLFTVNSSGAASLQ